MLEVIDSDDESESNNSASSSSEDNNSKKGMCMRSRLRKGRRGFKKKKVDAL